MVITLLEEMEDDVRSAPYIDQVVLLYAFPFMVSSGIM